MIARPLSKYLRIFPFM